jgi:hypothetical protein
MTGTAAPVKNQGVGKERNAVRMTGIAPAKDQGAEKDLDAVRMADIVVLEKDQGAGKDLDAVRMTDITVLGKNPGAEREAARTNVGLNAERRGVDLTVDRRRTSG